MSEYDELWHFLNECHFNWDCVADDVMWSATDEVCVRQLA